ncbi:MAG: alkaline phosphatase PhoX, partial [Pseudomonadota bacterium]
MSPLPQTGWPLTTLRHCRPTRFRRGPVCRPSCLRGASGPYQQGFDNGGAQFRRGEGAWYHNGVIYWVDTSGGPSSNGVIWAYEPELTTGKEAGRLSAVFVSTDGERADNPDNITLSRDGGVLFCEDNGRSEGTRMISLMASGDVYEFGRNNMNLTAPLPGRPAIAPMDYRPAEFAGACFDPSG